ncbi:hypothetical protein FI667_g6223, partial [Globisporangium splendens]
MKKSTAAPVAGASAGKAAGSALSKAAAPSAAQAVPHADDPTADSSSAEETTSTEDSIVHDNATTTVWEPPRRKIAWNPSAADVRRRERGAPWRVDIDEKLRAANAKAKEE